MPVHGEMQENGVRYYDNTTSMITYVGNSGSTWKIRVMSAHLATAIGDIQAMGGYIVFVEREQ